MTFLKRTFRLCYSTRHRYHSPLVALFGTEPDPESQGRCWRITHLRNFNSTISKLFKDACSWYCPIGYRAAHFHNTILRIIHDWSISTSTLRHQISSRRNSVSSDLRRHSVFEFQSFQGILFQSKPMLQHGGTEYVWFSKSCTFEGQCRDRHLLLSLPINLDFFYTELFHKSHWSWYVPGECTASRNAIRTRNNLGFALQVFYCLRKKNIPKILEIVSFLSREFIDGGGPTRGFPLACKRFSKFTVSLPEIRGF